MLLGDETLRLHAVLSDETFLLHAVLSDETLLLHAVLSDETLLLHAALFPTKPSSCLGTAWVLFPDETLLLLWILFPYQHDCLDRLGSGKHFRPCGPSRGGVLWGVTGCSMFTPRVRGPRCAFEACVTP